MRSFRKFLRKAIKGYFVNRAIKKIEGKYPRVKVEYDWIKNNYTVEYTRKDKAIFLAIGSRRAVIKEIKAEIKNELLKGI